MMSSNRRNWARTRNNSNNRNSRFWRSETINMSYNQRLILDTYLGMYNSTLRQIDALYDNLNEIKHNIDYITGLGTEESENNEVNYEPNNNIGSNVDNIDNIDNHDSQRSNINRISNYTNNINLPSQENSLNDVINLLFNYISPNSLIPTAEEISQSTRIIRYSEIENPINDRCAISHELFEENDMVTQIVFCNHIFRSEEINTWFQRNSHCPVCRHNIITSNFNTNINVVNNSNNISSSSSSSSNPENGVATGGNATSQTNNNNNNNIPSINEILTNYGYDSSSNLLLFETFYRRI